MRTRYYEEALIARADYGGGYATLPEDAWAEIVAILRREKTPKRRLSDIGAECPLYTPRQSQIARLVHEGLSSRQIGERLGITAGTVKVMVQKCRLVWALHKMKEVA